ncbi:cytochrome c oxidase copper chaperone isoform X2 [Haliaeetus albicilla]|uniref:cytochrome c oxidase copper chaperone isoform X2 n=1 Tax=Haliaeetus albicilla TaxID=8969 RepID=UPI0037E7F98C
MPQPGDYPEPAEGSRLSGPCGGGERSSSFYPSLPLSAQAVAAGKPPAMSSVAAASCDAKEAREEKKPLKPCCACPETKKARDACIIEKGEENCRHLIEAHKECMRALGFKI